MRPTVHAGVGAQGETLRGLIPAVGRRLHVGAVEFVGIRLTK